MDDKTLRRLIERLWDTSGFWKSTGVATDLAGLLADAATELSHYEYEQKRGWAAPSETATP